MNRGAIRVRFVHSFKLEAAVDSINTAYEWAVKQAIIEWASGTLVGGNLKDRMQDHAFKRYGFFPRDDSYQKKQKKAFGKLFPYRSPRFLFSLQEALQIAIKAAKGKTTEAVLDIIKRIQRELRKPPPMRTIINKEGRGWALKASRKKRGARFVMTFPGARPLNKGGKASAGYRRQLSDLTLGSNRDLKAVLRRVEELMQDMRRTIKVA